MPADTSTTNATRPAPDAVRVTSADEAAEVRERYVRLATLVAQVSGDPVRGGQQVTIRACGGRTATGSGTYSTAVAAAVAAKQAPLDPGDLAPLAADVVRVDPGCTTGDVADRLVVPRQYAAVALHGWARQERIGRHEGRWWAEQDSEWVAQRLAEDLHPAPVDDEERDAIVSRSGAYAD